MLAKINRNPSMRDLRWFGLLWLPLTAGVIALWLWLGGAAPMVSLAVIAAGLLLGLPTALAPATVGRRVWIGWMITTWPIAWVVSHTLLAVAFYGVVTPIGLVMRLCGHDAMARKFDRERATMWHDVPDKPVDPRRYFRQF